MTCPPLITVRSLCWLRSSRASAGSTCQKRHLPGGSMALATRLLREGLRTRLGGQSRLQHAGQLLRAPASAQVHGRVVERDADEVAFGRQDFGLDAERCRV